MEKRKVVIVGGSHAGHEAAIELMDKYKDVDVALYESDEFVSFMSQGKQFYLKNRTAVARDMRNFNPKDIEERGGYVYEKNKITALHPERKAVTVVDLTDQTKKEVRYDKLILACGVTAKTLPVPGNDLKNMYLMRGQGWAQNFEKIRQDDALKKIVVIGAGYIGTEASEVLAKTGKQVTLMDMLERPLAAYLNAEFLDILEPVLETKITLKMGVKITGFKGKQKVEAVKTDQGEVPADAVIISAGVKPNTDWLKDTVALDKRGWIKTDPYLRTDIEDVFAIGDAILPLSIPAEKPMPIALATTARREAQYVADHLFEAKPNQLFEGVVGTSALSVYDYQFATVGLNQSSAEKNKIPFKTSFYADRMRPTYIPAENNPKVYVSLTYNPYTHQILGGAVLSKYDITAQGNVLALAVSNKLTLEDLAKQDFFYQLGFDRQWSLLNLAAQHALGLARF